MCFYNFSSFQINDWRASQFQCRKQSRLLSFFYYCVLLLVEQNSCHFLNQLEVKPKAIATFNFYGRVPALNYSGQLKQAQIERFSIECRNTKTKVITLTNHNSCKQSNEPIRARSKYM